MSNQRTQIAINFKKAQSLTAKVIHMLDEKKYCVDIMQQNLAVIGLLKSAHQMLMEDHLKSCFMGAMESGSNKRKREMIEEILKVSKLSNK